MELTVLLSKVFGIYLIVVGLECILKQKLFTSIIKTFAEQRVLRFFVGVIVFIAGLFVILSHNLWGNLQECIISLLGWALAVKGLFYMTLTDKALRGWLKFVSSKTRITLSGLFAVILGAYLAGIGFGFL